MSHKFKFLGGNIPKCELAREDHQDCFRYIDSGFQYIPLAGNIASIQPVTEENKKSFIGKAGWGLVGGLALGGVGAIAGLLAGGNKKEIVIAITMKSGENIMATVDQDTFKWLLGIYSTPCEVKHIRTMDEKSEMVKKEAREAKEEYERRLAAMSPDERAAYEAKKSRNNKIGLGVLIVMVLFVLYLIFG